MSTVTTPLSNLWTATASAPLGRYDSLSGDRETDVVIIGGGFAGLSTALHLAECGVSVSLAEAEDIGHGASGRNGGQVNPGLKLGEDALVRLFGEAGHALFNLGEEAVDFLDVLVSRKKLQCHFIRPGLVRLAHLPSAMRTLEGAHRAFNARGVAASLLSAQEVEAIVGTRRYCGGLLDPRGANIQPLDLAHELARAAFESGAGIFVRTRALSLQPIGDRWLVNFTNGTVKASAVVVTTNAYTDGLLPSLECSILPVNSFQIATDPIGTDLSNEILPQRQAVYDSRRLVLYFRKSPDDRVVLGGRSSFSSSRNDHSHAADYDVLAQVLHSIFPQLETVPISHRWTGLVGVTRDFLPHYHTPKPGLHVALGFNGRGVAIAIRTGAWLSHKILGQPDTGGIPATAVKAIPFHRWRAPILNAIMQWNRLIDTIGT